MMIRKKHLFTWSSDKTFQNDVYRPMQIRNRISSFLYLSFKAT